MCCWTILALLSRPPRAADLCAFGFGGKSLLEAPQRQRLHRNPRKRLPHDRRLPLMRQPQAWPTATFTGERRSTGYATVGQRAENVILLRMRQQPRLVSPQQRNSDFEGGLPRGFSTMSSWNFHACRGDYSRRHICNWLEAKGLTLVTALITRL